MKNPKVKHFLTTREVSALLGVSTGTVQKMVDKKILESYLTAGGHRRIAMESLKRYMASMDPNVSFFLRESAQSSKFRFSYDDENITFIVQQEPAMSDQLSSLRMNFITKPSDLFMLYACRDVLVVDAAVAWVDWVDGVCKLYQDHERFGLNVLVFHSELIPAEQMKKIPEGVILFEGQLAVDYVRGYLAVPNRRPMQSPISAMN